MLYNLQNVSMSIIRGAFSLFPMVFFRRRIAFVLFTFLIGLLFTYADLSSSPIQAQETGSEPITLQLWHPHSAERQVALDALIAEFNATNTWNITIIPTSFENSGLLYDQLVLQLLNAQPLPNLAMLWPHEAALLDLRNVVVDLNSFLDDPALALENDLIPGIAARGQNPLTGKQLGLPERSYTELMAVNLDALASLGEASPPITRAELAALACTFREQGGWDRGKFGVAWGFIAPAEAEFLLGMSGESPFESASSAEILLNTPTHQTILQFLIDLTQRGCITSIQTSIEALDEFAAGQSLFYFGSSSTLPLLRQSIGNNYAVPFEWGVFALPEASHPLLFGPAASIFDQGAALNEASWRFMQWFLSPEINAAWNRATGSLPVTTAAAELMTEDFSTFPQWGQAWQLIQGETITVPALAGYDPVRIEIQFALRRIFAGASTPDQELPALEARANQILQDFSPIAAPEPE